MLCCCCESNTLFLCWERCGKGPLTLGGLLTSTVHDFPDSGGGQDVPAAEVVGQLAADGHDDSHHQVRQGREYANLQNRQIRTQLEYSSTLMSISDSKVNERSSQYMKVIIRSKMVRIFLK